MDIQAFFILRYITISAYIVFLLEHLAALPQEIEFVWKGSRNLARISFLVYRYSTIVALTLIIYALAGLSGPLNENFCKRTVATSVALSVFSMGVADALVMLRVSVLWGRQRSILVIVFIAFLVTFSSTLVCAVISGAHLVDNSMVVKHLNICITFSKPHEMPGIWIPGMAFDGIVLSLTAWNACSQPRKQETALTTALYRDGIAFFLVLAGLRAANLFFTIFSLYFLLGICISWPLATVTFSRFIFHVRHVEKANSIHDIEFEELHTNTSFELTECNGSVIYVQQGAPRSRLDRNGLDLECVRPSERKVDVKLLS